MRAAWTTHPATWLQSRASSVHLFLLANAATCLAASHPRSRGIWCSTSMPRAPMHLPTLGRRYNCDPSTTSTTPATSAIGTSRRPRTSPTAIWLRPRLPMRRCFSAPSTSWHQANSRARPAMRYATATGVPPALTTANVIAMRRLAASCSTPYLIRKASPRS